MGSGSGEKGHMDYAYELDLVVRPESSVPLFGRGFGHFTGPGIPLFSIGGGSLRYALYQILVGFHARRGYLLAETPILASSELFRVSGHLEFYRENMYLLDIEGHEFAVKPMNCPFHILLFMNQLAKYRGRTPLPFKVFEVGRVHRYEPSGSLYGLLRIRGFTQDDAHIIVQEERAVDAVLEVFGEMKQLLEGLFGLEFTPGNVYIRVSLSDKALIGREFMGTRDEWLGAENALTEAASRIKAVYGIEYRGLEGEAAFYGPKIDVIMRAGPEGKEWQLGTIQFDFNLPRRFKLYQLVREAYGDVGIYMIHRALLGSIERFIGVYLEHSRGRLPFTLSPVQFALLAIRTGNSEVDARILEAARRLHEGLLRRGFRSGLVESTKTGLPGDVRKIEATVKPYVIAYIGERELEGGYLTLSIYDMASRRRSQVRLPFKTLEEASGEILKVAEELERPSVELAGAPPRIPQDVSHML